MTEALLDPACDPLDRDGAEAGVSEYAPTTEARTIPISSIAVPERLRRLSEPDVEQLKRSIAEIGLRTPISVMTSTHDQAIPGNEYLLVAGYHRLEACKRLAHETIPVIVHRLTEDERQLWEIDENLCRARLTELEVAEHLLRRKEIYERLHPETRQHIAGARRANAKMGRGDATTNLVVASFTSNTAARIRRSETAIRRSIRRAQKIGADVRSRIWKNPNIADKGSELDALASLEPAEQARALDLIDTGECSSIKAAKRALHPELQKRREDAMPAAQSDDPHTAVFSPDARPPIGQEAPEDAGSPEAPVPSTTTGGPPGEERAPRQPGSFQIPEARLNAATTDRAKQDSIKQISRIMRTFPPTDRANLICYLYKLGNVTADRLAACLQ